MEGSRLAPFAVAAAACLSTTAGGLLALRLRARLPLLMGFSAGVVIGVVCFDLLPEIMAQTAEGGFEARAVTGALAGGFLLFHVLEKLIVIHHHDDCEHHDHKHPSVGVLSALALSGHSFLDGVGIGLGFQASWQVGVIIGLAVLAHNFVDGMNTVILMTVNRNTPRRALLYLALDALAPALGLLAARFLSPSPFQLTLYLAFLAGFLLYMGASHILPEAHSEKSSVSVIALTLAGAASALVISLAV